MEDFKFVSLFMIESLEILRAVFLSLFIPSKVLCVLLVFDIFENAINANDQKYCLIITFFKTPFVVVNYFNISENAIFFAHCIFHQNLPYHHNNRKNKKIIGLGRFYFPRLKRKY